MQAGHDDHEALEPHPDVHHDAHEEGEDQVGAQLLEPEDLRATTLQVIMPSRPTSRAGGAVDEGVASHSTPLYQLMNSSVMYATPTMEPVTTITMFMYSMCLMVM